MQLINGLGERAIQDVLKNIRVWDRFWNRPV